MSSIAPHNPGVDYNYTLDDKYTIVPRSLIPLVLFLVIAARHWAATI
jgi:hypothetical protein